MKFWNWTKVKNEETEQEDRVLELNGAIGDGSDSWLDEVTPRVFKDELESGNGSITVWINSPGGDCIAASQIYTMLLNYKGDVTVKIDGLAASAASVIAMAGNKVLMSPTALMMIHNPLTGAYGNKDDMNKAIAVLDEVKESIINAYQVKTGKSRNYLSKLMDNETWMNANKALELGFIDGILDTKQATNSESLMFSNRECDLRVMNFLKGKEEGRSIKSLRSKLDNIKKFI